MEDMSLGVLVYLVQNYLFQNEESSFNKRCVEGSLFFILYNPVTELFRPCGKTMTAPKS